MIDTWIAVAIGGAAGALLRAGLVAGVEWLSARAASPRFALDPALGILCANGLGCATLGVFVGQQHPSASDLPFWVPAFVLTGLCGGLTSFSSICSDTVRLNRTGSRWSALGYMLATASLGPVAFFLGAALSG